MLLTVDAWTARYQAGEYMRILIDGVDVTVGAVSADDRAGWVAVQKHPQRFKHHPLCPKRHEFAHPDCRDGCGIVVELRVGRVEFVSRPIARAPAAAG